MKKRIRIFFSDDSFFLRFFPHELKHENIIKNDDDKHTQEKKRKI